jgi:hypothetical protein
MTTYTDMVATGVMNDSTESNTDYLVGTTRLFTSTVSAISSSVISSYLLAGQSGPIPGVRDNYACCVAQIAPNYNYNFVLFGGYNGSTYLNDLWAYDLTLQSWTQLTTTGTAPTIRAGMSCGLFGVSNNFFAIFGGYNGSTYLTDVHVCNLNTLVWTTISTSGSAHSASAYCAYAMNGTTMYIAGGTSNAPGKVASNTSHTLVFNSNSSPTSATWTSIGTIPTAVFGASGTYANSTFYMFGGLNSSSYYGTIQYYNGSSWATLTPSSGSPGSIAFCGFFGTSQYLYFFGGYNGGGYQDNFFEFNLSTTTWSLISGSTLPPTKGNINMLFYGTNAVVFGGYDGTSYYNDLWYCSNIISSPFTFTFEPTATGTPVNASSFTLNGITISTSIRAGVVVVEVSLSKTGTVSMTQFDSIIIASS